MKSPTTRNNPDLKNTIYARAFELVQADTRRSIALANDLNVPVEWLRLFKAGRIPNPGVNRIQHIIETLTGKKIRL